MMAVHIPADMNPRIDWNAEDKQVAWAFYKESLEQYFVIADTPEAAKVTDILFYGGKEASERWTVLKDQVDQIKLKDLQTVFTAFANSFKNTGRPGMNTSQTSNRPSTRPWLSRTFTSKT